MGAYTGADKRLQYLFENGGGGGGGTTVIANPQGEATDTLNKLQVGQTIYNIPSGGGGGNACDYSTSEQLIGKWIDNKPLYRRTFTTNTINISNMSGYLYAGSITIADYISNVDKIFIDTSKSYVNISGVTRPIIGGGQQGTVMAIYTEVARTNCTVTMTVEYTKTTD